MARHDDVQPPEGIDGLAHQRLAVLELGDAGMARDGPPARRCDLRDDRLGVRGLTAAAFELDAQVVDDDGGALGREQARDAAADAAARARHDGCFAR